MANPTLGVPGAFGALRALATAAGQGGLPQASAELAHLGASQINGCSVCVQMHARDLNLRTEPLDRGRQAGGRVADTDEGGSR
jgi:AhpD family alkylhydroperoxidase